jgi:predicted nucleotide-binding protein (sugar kinase/HSP70/actin superfamily)
MRFSVPRALHYYYLFQHWKTFLEALGHEVVITAETDRAMLEKGISACLSDICLPLKAYMGHVEGASRSGDPVFIPRLVSLDPRRYFCPKFLALPDLVRARFPGLKAVGPEINAKKGERFTRKSFVRFGMRWGASRSRAEEAFESAEKAQAEAKRARIGAEVAGTTEGPRIALVGHPYTIEDDTVSSGVLAWLVGQGCSVIRYEGIPAEDLERVETGLFREIYWECAHSLTRASVHFLGRGSVDGMILVSAFGCGPDSFISDIVGRRARKAGTVPFVRLLIDEHTAREGLLTRLEAFLDMVHSFRERRLNRDSKAR